MQNIIKKAIVTTLLLISTTPTLELAHARALTAEEKAQVQAYLDEVDRLEQRLDQLQIEIESIRGRIAISIPPLEGFDPEQLEDNLNSRLQERNLIQIHLFLRDN